MDTLQTRIHKLGSVFPDFTEPLQLAFRYAHSDPGSSLTKSRLIAERLLIELYKSEMGQEPRRPLFGDLLGDNQFTRKIERRILSRFNSIRDMGNLGPHGESVEASDATRVLEDLCLVLEWYADKQPPTSPSTAGGRPGIRVEKPAFNEILLRLEGIPMQFLELREGIRRAIDIAELDPEMSLARARKVLQYIIQQEYERATQESAGTRPLENLLQRLLKEGKLPRRVAAYANSVRDLGNVGVHLFDEQVGTADVLLSLSQLLLVVEWYCQQNAPSAAPTQLASPQDGPATETDRLHALRKRLSSVAGDLQSLETLMPVDIPSSLNKMRFITEKVLHELCVRKNVGWGQAEPTLERMIGPLLAGGFIPKNVVIYVRIIQVNVSPGSHYQESALSQANVKIARDALVEFLEWVASGA
jgi:hypothetical protein